MSIVGDILGPIAQVVGIKMTNDANKSMAKQQMAFQAAASNTAHQREVRDLIAAGLNPMLSATGGAGASTPNGATATMQDMVGPAVSTAMAAKRLSAELDNMKETNMLIKDQQLKTRSETNANWQQSVLTKALTDKAKSDTALTNNSAANAAISNQLLKASVPAANLERDFNSSTAGKSYFMYNKFMDALSRWNPFGSSAKAVKSFAR